MNKIFKLSQEMHKTEKNKFSKAPINELWSWKIKPYYSHNNYKDLIKY